MSEHSPMPWKYLEQTGFVVDANGEYIAQTWNRKEENFPNAIANGNAIAQLTAENAKLREQLAEAESALEAIADMTMSMVVNVQHMNDERGRIARAYLSKHNTTT